MNDPLTLPGWQEFNHVQWNAKPVTYEFAPRGTGGPKLSLAAYQNSRGRFVLPPMNPHWPLVFTPTKTDTFVDATGRTRTLYLYVADGKVRQ